MGLQARARGGWRASLLSRDPPPSSPQLRRVSQAAASVCVALAAIAVGTHAEGTPRR